MMQIDHIKKKYGSEMALAILCCRIHFGSSNLDDVQFLITNEKIEWDNAIHLFQYHKIEHLVYKVIMKISLPNYMASKIKKRSLFLITRSYKHAAECERILNILRQNDINALPYKGSAFSKEFYGDLFSRQSTDIDITIHHKDFYKVKELLQNEGYVFENTIEYDFYGKEIFSKKKDLCFNKYNAGVREFHIEFHWRISENRMQVGSDANSLLFNSDHNITLLNKTIGALNRESHYITLFIHHTYNDYFSLLKNIVDIAQLKYVSESMINRRIIKNYMQSFKLTRAASISNMLCEDILGVSLPPLNEFNLALTESTKLYFKNKLLSPQMIGTLYKSRFMEKSVYYLMASPKDKFHYLAACIALRFTPTRKDMRIFRIPKRLSFAYFILKPIRTLFRPTDVVEEKAKTFIESERTSH